MSDNLAALVIAGLAIGIGFIVMFAIVTNSSFASTPSTHYIGRYPSMSLTIDSLKEKYNTGESIDFTLNVHGYGTKCPEAPSITIRDNSTDQLVWAYQTFNLMGCNDPERNSVEINDSWNAEERLSILPPEASIKQPSINQMGTFTFTASWYGERISQQIVIS